MKDGLRSITPLPQESLRGIVPSAVTGKLPKFEWVDPKTIYVEEAYQRDILANGVALVRKIFAAFSWERFKPPVCVRLADSGSVLVCIDGQHTATAAATHPGIDKIPVMIVDAAAKAPPPAAAIPKPEPPPAPQREAVVAPPPQADPNRFVRRSGIVVDLVASTVTCRNTRVGLDRDELAVVAALARVTPALLDFSNLERKLHGRVTADGPGRLRSIAEQLNRRLRVLEVRVVPKMGLTLAELEDVA